MGVPKLLAPASLQACNAIYRETKYVGMKCSSKRIDREQNQPKPTTNQATLVLQKQVETTPPEIWSVYWKLIGALQIQLTR